VTAPGAIEAARKDQARHLGFDSVGIAHALPFVREQTYLESRSANGIEPNPFEWPDLHARIDPRDVLPDVQSIVAVGMSYLMPEDDHPHSTLSGWFSRYCRGLDYHTMLDERMTQLARWLETQAPGARCVVHTDTGAPLDRAIAERAGLGRFGKSTLLVTRGLGTWTFLGEIFTTIALTSDEAADWNVCGSCTRCLDACPTACLSPWQIDSTRCLGFLNQSSGDIPREFRAPMGDRLFGCDDCQDVCPYNRVAARGLHEEFAPRDGLNPGPDLIQLLDMDQPEFERVIGPTAAAWRGLRTLQRNALVALGNSGDADALAPLISKLDHLSPKLRVHAAWGLGRLAALVPGVASIALERLSARLDEEPDEHVREEIRIALAETSTARRRQTIVP
jgi:epoxyqueuosine reductase